MRHLLRRFGRDNKAVAAVEFAIIFSLFLLPMFLGLIEIITLYRAQEKLNAFVTDVALMVSIESSTANTNGVYNVAATGTTANSLQDVCNGAAAGFAPYPPNGIALQIASVTEEAGPNGLNGNGAASNNSTSFVYHSTALYDEWEQDFAIAGSSCSSSGGTGIGVSGTTNNAINLTISNPPVTTAGGSGGMVQYPCDSGIIVKASMSYPGLIGLVLTSRMTLSQSAFQRWRWSSTMSELQCPTCSVVNNNSTVLYSSGSTSYTQACNTSNSGAEN